MLEFVEIWQFHLPCHICRHIFVDSESFWPTDLTRKQHLTFAMESDAALQRAVAAGWTRTS